MSSSESIRVLLSQYRRVPMDTASKEAFFSSHKSRVNAVVMASAAKRLFSADDSGRLVS